MAAAPLGRPSIISRASEYAIRALTFLAQDSGAHFHLAREMARGLGIPAPFLAKILQPLVRDGLVYSQRGRQGGFRLARDPADVCLFDVVDSEERLGRVRPCMLGQAECSDERACPLHNYWKRASEDYLTVLQRTTLADVVRFCRERPGSHYPCPVPERGRR
jgi:Rrf2 family protein